MLCERISPAAKPFGVACVSLLIAGFGVDLASAPPEKAADPLMQAARDIMDEVEVYRLDAAGEHLVPRVRDPVRRTSDAARQYQDGTLWAFGTPGRPVALISCVTKDAKVGRWFLSATSLSDERLRATSQDVTVWSPNRPGIKFGRIEATFAPSEMKRRRLSQIRQLARRFSAHQFWNPDNQRFELRLQPTPIYRYDNLEKGIVDGCVFAFSYNVHPEALLVVEAIEADGSRDWQYALAPMGSAEFHGQLDGQEVWSLPRAPGVVGRASDPYRMFFSQRKVEFPEPAAKR